MMEFDKYRMKMELQYIQFLCKETDKLLKTVRSGLMNMDKAIVIEGVVINFCEYKGKNGISTV